MISREVQGNNGIGWTDSVTPGWEKLQKTLYNEIHLPKRRVISVIVELPPIAVDTVLRMQDIEHTVPSVKNITTRH
jgi:hypothetical protein